MPLVRALHHAQLVLTGEDRVRFLHGMVTNDIEALGPGQGCHAAMLTTKGKMLADLVVYCDADRLTLELDGTLRDKIKGVFDKHIIMDDVEVADLTDEEREQGVFGDDAAQAVARAAGLDAGARRDARLALRAARR
jgi:aminomethyltransferase